ncbi:MAG: YHS domain-containing protein, partial [Thermoplasmata archaeon]|nr:YHS domain-containing protein [Thermoplasmata archaeon]
MGTKKNPNQEEVKLHIKGMSCTSCAQNIGLNLKDLEGVDFAGVNFVDKTALVKYDPMKVNVDNIKTTIKNSGYEAFNYASDNMDMPEDAPVDSDDTAIDPVCGMTVDKKTGIKEEIGGKIYYFCMQGCADTFRKQVEEEGLKIVEKKTTKKFEGMPAEAKAEDKYLAIDPICGMKVDKRKAITRVIGGRTYYFCMESCAKTFEDPDKELEDMKKRVSVAIIGVILVGVFRLGLFIGLATGVTIMTWVPFEFLPWFNGGVWMFILTTPIIFIGGKSFY